MAIGDELIRYVLLYLLGGLTTLMLCWIYDRLILWLQGYRDEVPVSGLGYAIMMAIWPLVLLGRTIALPWQLWVAFQARRG